LCSFEGSEGAEVYALPKVGYVGLPLFFEDVESHTSMTSGAIALEPMIYRLLLRGG
jgi:hypothetical protein